MLSPPTPRPLGPTLFAVLGQGMSMAMGFAALGLALYAQGPAQAAAALFAAVGAFCGITAASLRLLLQGVPAALPVPLPAEALAALRNLLAQAQQDRQATRSGSAADRQPSAVANTWPGAAADVPAPSRAPQPALARARALPADAVADTRRHAGSAVEA